MVVELVDGCRDRANAVKVSSSCGVVELKQLSTRARSVAVKLANGCRLCGWLQAIVQRPSRVMASCVMVGC